MDAEYSIAKAPPSTSAEQEMNVQLMISVEEPDSAVGLSQTAPPELPLPALRFSNVQPYILYREALFSAIRPVLVLHDS
jgi:hypothetical protein